MNKAVAGLYSPGSTFKMVVALAALEAGIITKDAKVFCSGKTQLGKPFVSHCWKKVTRGAECR